METGKNGSIVKEREVVGSIKVIESEYRIQRPVFEDIKIERPVYVDKKVEIPTGVMDMVTELARVMANSVISQVLDSLDKKLEEAIDTEEKRRSVAGISFWVFGPAVTPTVGKDQEWRQQSGWGYSGILSDNPSGSTLVPRLTLLGCG